MADLIRSHKRGLFLVLGITGLTLILGIFALVYVVPQLVLGSG